MRNYLLKILESYFSEILIIEGKLILSASFLTTKKDEIVKEKRLNKEIVSAITSYRDLSLIKAEMNLFTPNCIYSTTTDNLENEIKDVISQHCCFAVSQAYEVFESFLIEILTEFLLNNQEKLKLFKFVTEDIILIRETIRNMVKLNQRTNNKGLLSMIRKISSYFRKHESNNIYKVNITQWFDLVSMIRHTLVHNRQIISPRLLKYLDTNKANEMFDRHFQRKKMGNHVCVFLEKDITSDIINWLNTFAHFIFISLSMESKLPLDVPQYIPTPLNLSRFS
ncbi:hypothetical protein FRZ67_03345 [Panacibacter ginsenosidivorans]|uniref:RiboL-PSP-HEPN domain-containing protein n=1 Tax=Panacibacter ginsenosidivorans TaxID=1813871 RepID=A0A5B8V596_9BACT|nr:hypothetical protein [Panacibacter ginsenosidivorans]QEC66382.1 hypothetical protein FRZ67_03345 [Panacibacter ginsenosidivorans]